MKVDKREFAFPFAETNETTINPGITKREYFAGLAMQGILSNPHYARCIESNIWKPAENELGKFAIEMADELLKQLKEIEDVNT